MSHRFLRTIGFAAVLWCALAGTQLHAQSLPLWEAGVGAAALRLPYYRGSDEQRNLLLPVPYLIYRGEHLKADREGIRTTLFDSDRVELNLSLNGTLPVNSGNIDARRGMPSLRPIAEFGPNLNIRLADFDNGSRLRLRFPVRSAISVDTPLRHVGWLFAPNLSLDIAHLSALPGWRMSMQAGPYFQSRRYNAHFYSVSNAEALPGRPVYDADGGYAGSQITVGVSRRFPRFWVATFLRYDSLHGAVFHDSPLVRSDNALAAGVAFAWVFGESSTLVQGTEP